VNDDHEERRRQERKADDDVQVERFVWLVAAIVILGVANIVVTLATR
jgi:hypothetical protein